MSDRAYKSAKIGKIVEQIDWYRRQIAKLDGAEKYKSIVDDYRDTIIGMTREIEEIKAEEYRASEKLKMM